MSFKRKQKRNLILLITLVVLSFKSFSQNATDSTKIVLTKPIAKLVIKDLVTGDELKKQLVATNELLNQTNLKLNTQTLLITNLESQLKNSSTLFQELDNKYKLQENLSKDLEAALKKANRRTKLYKIGTGVGAVALGLLLIK